MDAEQLNRLFSSKQLMDSEFEDPLSGGSNFVDLE